MIFQPGILALLLASIVTAALVLGAAGFAVQVIRHWDIHSGSERQIRLERRTYLITTLLSLALTLELGSLLLFVFNADRMASQFVGAMCAAGTLQASPWGYPAIGLKILNFFLAGLWLLLNRVDTLGADYPLIRAKYRFLLLIAPFLLVETGVLFAYFLDLDADVITSCCGSLFSAEAETVASELAALPLVPAMGLFYGAMAAVILAGLWVARRGRGAMLFAGLSGIGFLAALMGIISFISIYVYEHPHHHCPFCILQSGYSYIGYGLYLPLFGATLAGLGTGMLQPFTDKESLRDPLPRLLRRQAWAAVILFALFTLIATLAVATSRLVLLT